MVAESKPTVVSTFEKKTSPDFEATMEKYVQKKTCIYLRLSVRTWCIQRCHSGVCCIGRKSEPEPEPEPEPEHIRLSHQHSTQWDLSRMFSQNHKRKARYRAVLSMFWWQWKRGLDHSFGLLESPKNGPLDWSLDHVSHHASNVVKMHTPGQIVALSSICAVLSSILDP